MYILYVLRSRKTQRIYIGITGNLEQRLKEHNAGYVASTKAYIPYDPIYTERYNIKKDARQREIQIKKSGKLRLMLKKYGAIV